MEQVKRQPVIMGFVVFTIKIKSGVTWTCLVDLLGY